VRIDDDGAGQRVDNLLMRELKGVPRSRIYSMLRRGEVRVDGGRVKPTRRLAAGETVRIPPVHAPPRAAEARPSEALARTLAERVLHEDDDLLVVDKPTGLAVHGGSGVSTGLVEALRALRPQQRFLELAHRIDRDTSGVVLLAKRRPVLRRLHDALRRREAAKRYLAIVQGRWPKHQVRCDAPLERVLAANGERFVRVSVNGRPACSHVRVVELLDDATLLEVRPETGRTHQIRVHLAHGGHPILGDAKYASAAERARAAERGVPRLCLHAAAITVPMGEGEVHFEAPLPEDLETLLAALRD
jgi:23S rRNA pseudouridine955/2504/2580 synthase